MTVTITRTTHSAGITVVDDLQSKNGEKMSEDTTLNPEKVAQLRQKLMESTVATTEEKQPTRSLDFGIIGTGHGGCRLAEQFYELKYNAIAINTATQDLSHIKLPEENKLFMDIGLQGSAKDLLRGQQACEEYSDRLATLINDKLGQCQVFVLTSSLGGGSGAGSLPVLIEMLQPLGKPIVVMGVLPMVSEDVKTKKNSLDIMAKLAGAVKDGKIHNLIVIDNSRIETIFAGVSQMEFFNVANKAIVEPIDVFNKYSMEPSSMKALDSAEFGTIFLNGEGLSVYGQISTTNFVEETGIAEAIVSSLEGNLLASSFELKEAKYVGFMVLANKNVLSQIPAGAVNYAALMISDVFGAPEGLFKGIYESDETEDVVKIYTFVAGLGLPATRLSSLKKDVEAQQVALKEKSKDRANKLDLETNTDTALSDVEKLKAKIASQKSGFGKLTGSLDKRVGIIDRRKK